MTGWETLQRRPEKAAPTRWHAARVTQPPSPAAARAWCTAAGGLGPRCWHGGRWSGKSVGSLSQMFHGSPGKAAVGFDPAPFLILDFVQGSPSPRKCLFLRFQGVGPKGPDHPSKLPAISLEGHVTPVGSMKLEAAGFWGKLFLDLLHEVLEMVCSLFL